MVKRINEYKHQNRNHSLYILYIQGTSCAARLYLPTVKRKGKLIVCYEDEMVFQKQKNHLVYVASFHGKFDGKLLYERKICDCIKLEGAYQVYANENTVFFVQSKEQRTLHMDNEEIKLETLEERIQKVNEQHTVNLNIQPEILELNRKELNQDES